MGNDKLIQLLFLAQRIADLYQWRAPDKESLEVCIDSCDSQCLNDVLIKVPENKLCSIVVVLTDDEFRHRSASEFVGEYIDLTEDDIGKDPRSIPILKSDCKMEQ